MRFIVPTMSLIVGEGDTPLAVIHYEGGSHYEAHSLTSAWSHVGSTYIWFPTS